MRGLLLILVLVTAVAVPRPLFAQEDDDTPGTLRLSFFMCDFNRLDEATEEFEARTIPVWKELVAEDMVDDHGYFVHSWADEWNLGIYTIAESIADVIAASEEAGRRLGAMYGEDDPGVFGEVCPQHRDGFYVFGASAAGEDEDDEEDEGNGGS